MQYLSSLVGSRNLKQLGSSRASHLGKFWLCTGSCKAFYQNNFWNWFFVGAVVLWPCHQCSHLALFIVHFASTGHSWTRHWLVGNAASLERGCVVVISSIFGLHSHFISSELCPTLGCSFACYVVRCVLTGHTWEGNTTSLGNREARWTHTSFHTSLQTVSSSHEKIKATCEFMNRKKNVRGEH